MKDGLVWLQSFNMMCGATAEGGEGKRVDMQGKGGHIQSSEYCTSSCAKWCLCKPTLHSSITPRGRAVLAHNHESWVMVA